MRSIYIWLPYTISTVLAAFVLACAVSLAQPASSSHATLYLDPTSQNQEEPPLLYTSWQLSTYRDSDRRLVPYTWSTPPPLVADFDGRHMVGNSGCNGYRLNYETLDGRMRLTALSHTLMACGDNEQEYTYWEDLANVDRYIITHRRLQLEDAAGMVLAEFVAVDSVPLIGTTWQAYEVGHEFGKRWVENYAVATMVLQPDGQVVGHAMCHEYRASYRIVGPTHTGSDGTITEVRIGDVTTTGDRGCNPDQSEEEAGYFAAIREASTFQVMSNILCLQNAYGQWVAAFTFDRGYPRSACDAAR